jgi:hypothetical protein
MIDKTAEIGHTYGQLTVQSFAGISQLCFKNPIWTCRCQCGKTVIVTTENLHKYKDTIACSKCMKAHQK